MAKRKRQRPLGHLTKDLVLDLQDRLNSIASAEYRLKSDGKMAAARRERHKLVGALEAAESVGAYCQCFPVTKKLNQCACGTTAPAMANRTKSKRASYSKSWPRDSLFHGKKRPLSGAYFDGVHCRDGSGAFVPVAQCRGKRKTSKR